uniref:Chitin-binding type-4 domain-containing protein n=1 Tax=Globisporangium ultimum (strain ATCC 200006 / CBS 805.95 / DAOM BR144) TaxID=431595 RepID=K3WK42_GLOUD
MVSTGVIASLALVATFVHQAEGHVYLTQPLAEFKKGASKSSWVAEFPPPWSGTFRTGAQYAAVAPGKGYKDLKSFLEDKGPVCGNSLPDAKAKPIPSDGVIKLASTIEHAGPCEVWFDDVRAFHDDDCEKTFGSATSFKVDFSACKGSCMLRFYWLGLQDGGKRWQSYKNCIPLTDGTSSGSSSSTKTPAPATKKPSSKTPTPTTSTPTPTTATPAPTEDTVDDEYASGSNSTTPSTTPSPTKKCAAKRRS